MVAHNGPAPTICGECKAKQKEKAKLEFLESLAKLSPEERLRRIEETLYVLAHTPKPPTTF